MQLVRICSLAILFLISQSSFAINCQLADKPWMKTVCSSSRLLKLDKELNQEFHQCLNEDLRSRDEFTYSQFTWLKEMKGSENELVQRYRDRIAQLKYCNHQFEIVTIHPDKSYYEYDSFENGLDAKSLQNNGMDVSLQVQALKAGGVTLMEFPYLTDKSHDKDVVSIINAEIFGMIHDHFDEDALCRDYNDHAFSITPFVAKKRLFGVQVIDYDNCRCRCAYPDRRVTNYLWDLDAIELSFGDYFNPIEVTDVDKFWDVVKKHQTISFDPQCTEYENQYDIYYVHTAYDTLQGGIDTGRHVSAACDVPSMAAIPLIDAKPYYQFKPGFLKYLSRFVASGLISEQLANTIKQAQQVPASKK